MSYYRGDHEFDNGDGGYSSVGKCAVEVDDEGRVCGKVWTSAVHPPDQFRHWCSALEAGADCMHFEHEEEA
jgi:hypothetical protein